MQIDCTSSSSEIFPPSSSSDDHTHSPVNVLCNRPEPGCFFAAYIKIKNNHKTKIYVHFFIIKLKHTFKTRVSKLGPIAINVCCKYFLSFAFLKNGFFNNSVAVGLQILKIKIHSITK